MLFILGMFVISYLLSFLSCDCCCFFFFKQKTAYEMRISDWSSDVCSSDLPCDQYLLASVVVHHCWFWFPESQHFGDRGATLSPHGSAPRPGIYDLLHGHQFRRGAWRDHRGLSGSALGLVLGLRRGGVWHAAGSHRFRPGQAVAAWSGRAARPCPSGHTRGRPYTGMVALYTEHIVYRGCLVAGAKSGRGGNIAGHFRRDIGDLCACHGCDEATPA